MTENVGENGENVGENVSENNSDDVFYKHITRDVFNIDIEQSAVDDSHLMNDTARNFAWKGVTVTVKDHKTKQPKAILDSVDGIVEAGKSQSCIKGRLFKLTSLQAKFVHLWDQVAAEKLPS